MSKYWDIKDKSGSVLHTYEADAPRKFGGPWADGVQEENLTRAAEVAAEAAKGLERETKRKSAREKIEALTVGSGPINELAKALLELL